MNGSTNQFEWLQAPATNLGSEARTQASGLFVLWGEWVLVEGSATQAVRQPRARPVAVNRIAGGRRHGVHRRLIVGDRASHAYREVVLPVRGQRGGEGVHNSDGGVVLDSRRASEHIV